MCFLPIFGNSCAGVNEPFYTITNDYWIFLSNVLLVFLPLSLPIKFKKVSQTLIQRGCSLCQCELDHRGSTVLTSQQFASSRLPQSALATLLTQARQKCQIVVL